MCPKSAENPSVRAHIMAHCYYSVLRNETLIFLDMLIDIVM